MRDYQSQVRELLQREATPSIELSGGELAPLQDFEGEFLLGLVGGKVHLAILDPGYPEDDVGVIEGYYSHVHTTMFDEPATMYLHGFLGKVRRMYAFGAREVLINAHFIASSQANTHTVCHSLI